MITNPLVLFSVFHSIILWIPVTPFEVVLIVKDIEKCQSLLISDATQ